jgi:predicted Holliday junction resolvase-like endonuclease
MVLFGKEIKLETNMSPKEAKLSLLIISLAVVIILGYFQIFIPIMDIKNLNNEIEMKKSEKIGEETKKKAAQREYDDRIQMYNEQNENYLMSKAKFDQSSLIDDTSLKLMVAEMAEELGIKIVEVGAVEVIEENEEYTKKYFPYTVQSDVNRLGRFFYWLENSNQLVTFKGSPLDIQLLDSQGVLGQITVKMKVGAYFNEVKTVEEKPVEEGKGGANE